MRMADAICVVVLVYAKLHAQFGCISHHSLDTPNVASRTNELKDLGCSTEIYTDSGAPATARSDENLSIATASLAQPSISGSRAACFELSYMLNIRITYSIHIVCPHMYSHSLVSSLHPNFSRPNRCVETMSTSSWMGRISLAPASSPPHLKADPSRRRWRSL